MDRTCGRCGTVLPEGCNYCPNCGWNVSGQTPVAPEPGESYRQQTPLKWFKFIIYVQLFLSALGNLVTGIQLVTGLQYGDVQGMVYSTYPALKPVDVVMGLLSLGLMVWALVVRQRLAKFRQGAPKLYLLWIGVSMGVALCYLAAASLVLGQLVMTGSIMGGMLGNILLILSNLVYFQKREHLFVN